MSLPRFVIRTIRDGTVLINGKVFRPDPRWLPYDGRLDGTRWAFGLYWHGSEMLPFVELWGTEEDYKMCRKHTEAEVEAWCKEHYPGPDCIDGYFPWGSWSTGEEYERVCKEAK